MPLPKKRAGPGISRAPSWYEIAIDTQISDVAEQDRNEREGSRYRGAHPVPMTMASELQRPDRDIIPDLLDEVRGRSRPSIRGRVVIPRVLRRGRHLRL